MDNMTNALIGLLDWAKAKIDQVFEFFGLYTTQYSKWIIYIIVGLVAAKMFKFNFKIGK